MLLEYTQDTKEEELNDAGIEVRNRIAGRKLNSKIERGVISNEVLVAMKQESNRIMKENRQDQFVVEMAEFAERTLIARSDHQFKLDAQLKSLARDVNRNSRLGKVKIDALTELERKVSIMKSQLKVAYFPSVDEAINLEVKVKNTIKLEVNFTQCKRCRRRILVDLMKGHEEMCEKTFGKAQDPIYDLDSTPEASLATYISQPPRNAKVVDKGSSFIEWVWDPPVVNGGVDVYEYEISFKLKYYVLEPTSGRYKLIKEDPPSVLTSVWLFANPIAHFGCKIINLRAESEYYGWQFRARNLRGWSDWKDMNDDFLTGVRTDDAEAPSIPLFFSCCLVTSSTVHLEWDPPYSSGGLPITDFLITFTKLEVHNTVSERGVIIPKTINVRTEDTKTVFVIRNVNADTEVVDITIRTVNQAGLMSAPVILQQQIKTKSLSRYALIEKELAYANKLATPFIDTSFFNGVQQRLIRLDHIMNLNSALKEVSPDDLEIEELKEWAAICKKMEDRRIAEASAEAEKKKKIEEMEAARYKDLEDDESDPSLSKKMKEFQFTLQSRKEHYKHKIKVVEKLIVDLHDERSAVDKKRTELTALMKNKNKRQLVLTLERDRMKDYKGDMVTSSAIHGYDMQYTAEEFRENVAKALEDVTNDISKAKFTVMMGEKRKDQIREETVKAHDLLKDRKAKFHLFNINHQKSSAIMDRLKGNLSDDDILKKYFKELLDFANNKRIIRNNVRECFMKMVFRYKKFGFMKWKFGSTWKDDSETKYFISSGSVMLQQALEKRTELQGLLRGEIAAMTDIKQVVQIAGLGRENRRKLENSDHLKIMEEGLNHARLQSESLKFLYEGDGHAMVGKYQLGLSMYEAQIMLVRSQPTLNIKHLAMCHGRLGKMFLRQGRYDRAIVDFDRQLSLAKEIDDHWETAEAYHGLGEGCLKNRDYSNAIRYLDIAQTRFAALGNMARYAGALRALRDCYDRIGKPEIVKNYDEKIFTVESELQSKFKTIHTKLEDLKSRLFSTSAGIELVVKIERTTLKALECRKLIEKLSAEQVELSKKLDLQDESIELKKELLNNIQEEVNECFETDDLEIMTEYAGDQPQVLDIEVAKTMLHDRKLREVERLKELKNEEEKLESQYKNLEDSMIEADQALDLENGALMTHVRHDKPFRVIAFCSANTASNEVTGTATGGCEFYVCAEGNNIHMVDYHTGELLDVLPGDDRGRLGEKCGHVAVVTTLLHDGGLIYSGSADETIIIWDSFLKKKLKVLHGHEGAITCLATNPKLLCSGSSDASLRIWDKYKGSQLRVLFGHTMTVTSLEFGNDWLLTGSVDEEVRLWDVKQKSAHYVTVETRNRLIGHECAITCVKYGKLEIMSGDVLGRIFIWWIETGEIVRKCKVHEGAVKCLQFDPIYIVSGGADNAVAITDIATGEPMQLLRGHENHVLAIAFDTERIISASGDNTLRYWQWGKKTELADKFHILNKGETLVHVSKLHNVPINDLMKWNGIKEMRHCFEGMKLVVKKGDPTRLTEAEKVSAEVNRRKEAGISMTAKKFKEIKGSKGIGKRSNRVHKMASDIDFKSLSNRLFWSQKEEYALLPQKSYDKDHYAAHSRMERGGKVIPARAYETPYVFIADNEDEWGHVSDEIAVSILCVLIDYIIFEEVIEYKRVHRSTKSIMGRIHKYAVTEHVEDPIPRIKQESKREVALKENAARREEKRKKKSGADPNPNPDDGKASVLEIALADQTGLPSIAGSTTSDVDTHNHPDFDSRGGGGDVQQIENIKLPNI